MPLIPLAEREVGDKKAGQPGIGGEKQSNCREIHRCTAKLSGLLCVQVMGFEEGKLLSKNMLSHEFQSEHS